MHVAHAFSLYTSFVTVAKAPRATRKQITSCSGALTGPLAVRVTWQYLRYLQIGLAQEASTLANILEHVEIKSAKNSSIRYLTALTCFHVRPRLAAQAVAVAPICGKAVPGVATAGVDTPRPASSVSFGFRAKRLACRHSAADTDQALYLAAGSCHCRQ